MDLKEAIEEESERFIASHPTLFSPPSAVHVIHGDFRPENVLLQADGTYFIFDFDLQGWDRQLTDVAYAALTFSSYRWMEAERSWPAFYALVDRYVAKSDVRVEPNEIFETATWCCLRTLTASRTFKDLERRWKLYRAVATELEAYS